MKSGSEQITLLICKEFDPEADAVVLNLKRRGVVPFRIHEKSLYADFSVTFSAGYNERALWKISCDGKSLCNSEVKSVLYRPSGRRLLPKGFGEEAAFADAEARELTLGLYRSTKAFWVSSPDAVEIACSKPHQLQEAVRLGFKTPKTLISNEPEALRAFYDEFNGDVVYKTLSRGLGENDGQGVYTNRVAPKHLEMLYSATTAPCLFQEHIPKEADLRVTVIGAQVFATVIYSQGHAKSKVDWRRENAERLEHRACVLPADLRRLCVELVQRFNLQFGAIDFVLTPAGDYIFLEINPTGQFYWIELMTKQPLVETLVELLLSGTP
jgi:glutathione synthase/RimK-type ligase-like ATP-grasp enzyme